MGAWICTLTAAEEASIMSLEFVRVVDCVGEGCWRGGFQKGRTNERQRVRTSVVRRRVH
jgi:hypothetical protein